MSILNKWTLSLDEKIRSIEFIDELEEDLYCEYCKLLLIQPWQYDGSRYCENCYLEARLDGGFRDKFALKQILTLKCYCKNRSKGCGWMGQLHAFEEHSQICQYMEREYCQYNTIGCPFQGDQIDVSKHNQTSMSQHLGALCYTVKDVNLTESHDIIQQISETLSEISLRKKRLREFSEVTREIEKKLPAIRKLFTDNPLNETTVEDQKALKAIRSYVNILNYLQEIAKKETLLRKHFERQSPEERKSYFIETTKQIETKLNTLDKLFSENEKQWTKTEQRFSDFREISFDGYILIRIDNILEKIETGRHFGSNEYKSQYFYTHKYGYKCYLKIDFCTVVESSIASPGYVGVFVVLVSGKYDDILTFPIPYSFKIKIKNFARRPDKTYTLLPDPDKDLFQRVWGEETMPVGFMKFISHEELLQKGYVTEGAIYVELTVEEETDIVSSTLPALATGAASEGSGTTSVADVP